jgi:pimeloyl-ACP methyl ester carboxylesterase
MQLEIISRYPKIRETSPIALLFVHGSFTSAKVWDVHFLPYFAQRGYEAHAVSLRGHGASDGHNNLLWWSLADYVADLVQAIEVLDCTPVLIGHSMGGMVVQKYLESQRALGLVLMASVPPHGLLSSLWSMAVGNPLLLYRLTLFQTFGPQSTNNMDFMREALFSDGTPNSQLIRYLYMVQGESQRVCLDMLGLNPLCRRDHDSIPTFVMGAEKDAFFSPELMKDIARYYQADAVIIPNMAHAMMLESHWQLAANHLLHWLETRIVH